jgi:protein SCO1/2
MRAAAALLAAVVASLVASAPAAAQMMTSGPSPTREVGFDQRVGMQVPLDAFFKDESGKSVRLGDYLGKKPVVLSLAYYECPMLCGIALEGLAKSLKGFSLVPGQDFEVVTVSFHPGEGPALARGKKDNLVRLYGRPGGEEGWHFLTGTEDQIRRVTEAVGFRYRWDEAQKQYAHATGVVLLTPQGTVSRYFFGVEYAPKELRLGLSEASEGKVGGVTAQLLLLCYKYDPAIGKYTTTVWAVLRVLGTAVALALAAFVLLALRREKIRSREAALAGGKA